MTNSHVRFFPPDSRGGSDAPRAMPRRPSVKRSRIGGVWVTAVVFAFVLLLLLIFVLQNGQRAEVSFLGAHGTLPMGVALLLAAVFGVLLVALPGTGRFWTAGGGCGPGTQPPNSRASSSPCPRDHKKPTLVDD
jgi:uncharacterized integral membrane protein